MENTEADTLSRLNDTSSEWMLNINIFNNIMKHFEFEPEIDLFASRLNKQVDKFVSYKPDPEAVHVNAFTLDWSKLKFYSFLPFSCIGRVIRKIINDNAEGILVTPNWITQYWYPLIFNINTKQPFIIPPSQIQLSLPNLPELKHPPSRKLGLMAWKVSGQT